MGFFDFFKGIFSSVEKVLLTAIPIAASVAKVRAAESVNQTDKIPEEHKAIVLELINQAIDDALTEVRKSAE